MTDDDLTALYDRLDELEARLAPVPGELRDRYATAISRWHRDPTQPLYTQGADAVLAVRDDEMQRLRAENAELHQHHAEDRDALTEMRATIEQYRRKLAKSEQGRRNLRGLLDRHLNSLGVLKTTRARLDRALRACARYRAELADLEADCQRWADCAASAERVRRAHAADADQYEAQLRARVAELEQALADADADQLHVDVTCEAVQRAERAEAALARVRAVAGRWKRYGTPDLGRYADIVLAALDKPAQQDANGKEGAL
jgi:chromosome segregation ATPase